MNNELENALKIIVQALQLANQKGAFTLEESSTVHKGLTIVVAALTPKEEPTEE